MYDYLLYSHYQTTYFVDNVGRIYIQPSGKLAWAERVKMSLEQSIQSSSVSNPRQYEFLTRIVIPRLNIGWNNSKKC